MHKLENWCCRSSGAGGYGRYRMARKDGRVDLPWPKSPVRKRTVAIPPIYAVQKVRLGRGLAHQKNERFLALLASG